MKQINLKAGNVISRKESRGSSNTSLAIGLILLLVSLGSYGGLVFYKQTVEKEIAALGQEKADKSKELEDEKYVELYFFQDRLKELKKKLQARPSQAKNLEDIAKYTLPGTYFDRLLIESSGKEDKVEADIIVKNYDDLSSQINAYKLIDRVETINLESSEKREDVQDVKGKISVTFKNVSAEGAVGDLEGATMEE